MAKPWIPPAVPPPGPRTPPQLRRNHPCAALFLDESGIIAQDRYFAVGVLKVQEPSKLLRALQKFQDQKHWYSEVKFTNVKPRSLPLYQQFADICLTAGSPQFFCFVADRQKADPISRFGTAWDAYEKLAEQLVVAALRPAELVSVMGDNYSTPDHILFEEDLRAGANHRLGRLAVVSACRLDSKSCVGLQAADLLTSAVTHEFRADAGLASNRSPKGQLAAHVRKHMGARSCLKGWRNARHSVAIYTHGAWSPGS